MLLVGVGLNYVVPERVFVYLMSLFSALLLWIWGVIMVCHLVCRRRIARNESREVSSRLSVSPYTNCLVLAFMGNVAILLALNPQTRLAYYTTAAWFALLLIWRRGGIQNP
jgi:L-asparagine transporter-like permease